MRLSFRCWVIVIAILSCGVIFPASLPVRAEGSEKIQQLIEKTKKAIVNQKKKEKSALSSLIKQQKQLNQLQGNYDQLKGKLSVAQNKANLTRQEQQRLERSLGILEKNLSNRQELLNERLVATYKYGPRTYLEILFNAKDFADLMSRFGMVNYFIKKDLHSITVTQEVKTQVNQEKQVVQAKKQQVEQELKKIVVLQAQVSKAQQNMNSKVTSTKNELSKIQNNRAQLEKALEEYEQTSREIEAQIRQKEKNSGEILGSGKLIWPVRGRLSSNFGWRYHPVLRKRKLHNGQDIAVPTGTPVHAADSGVVVVSGWQGGYGNFIAIDHGNGISTCYGHNSRLLVNRGERVEKGQVIAYSGSTGLSTGPHVHFEVRLNGVPVNPIPYLP